MDKSQICDTLLAERAVLYNFRKLVILNRNDFEVLCFASKFPVFNAHQIRQHFNSTNPQQTIATIIKLLRINMVNLVYRGTKGKPSLYILSVKGREILDNYLNTIQRHLIAAS